MNPDDATTDSVDLAGSNNCAQIDVDDVWPEYADPSYVMPDVIEVQCDTITGNYSFPVTILKSSQKKSYFGGFRNTKSHKIYHHASSQTPTDRTSVVKDLSHLRTRETQTHEHRTVSVQPVREHGTQMQRIDLYLDVTRDVVIEPKTYFSSDELFYLKREKCVEIQRVWRGAMARCRATRKKRDIDNMEETVRMTRQLEQTQNQEEKMAEMQKRATPSTNADFARLYNELDAWRQAEVAKVKANTQPGEERRQALSAVLAEETAALQNIQRMKAVAQSDTLQEKTRKMLELMAQPQQWQMSDGEYAVVQTTATQRAKDMLDLFTALNAPLTSTNQRLEVLLNVKWTVKEAQASGSSGLSIVHVNKEILELVDREADLLNRGRPHKSMESLRKRISNLFLQFIENPAYNPRAAEFINIPLPAPPPLT
ncbi:IQUB [Symbiodinium microadriaticum]|nr:IQUB [Symbiodinium microadriaticum]